MQNAPPWLHFAPLELLPVITSFHFHEFPGGQPESFMPLDGNKDGVVVGQLDEFVSDETRITRLHE